MSAVSSARPLAVRQNESGGGLMTRVFYVFAILALLSVTISIGGKFFGQSISQGGHTDSAVPREIVIGNNVIVVPDKMIRFPDARRDGVTARLDLYMRWPDLDGYSEAARNDFNHAGGPKNILFLTFEEASMSRDMSGRFQPIYSELIKRPGMLAAGGMTLYDFNEKSGYLDETLAVVDRPGDLPFVSRCLKGEAAAQSLAPCERDIQIGDGLSLTFRFPAGLLKDWPRLEAAVRARATSLLKTATAPGRT